MTPERQPKPLTTREMLKRLSEQEGTYEKMCDMVFGYPPMEVEKSNVKPLIQEKMIRRERE